MSDYQCEHYSILEWSPALGAADEAMYKKSEPKWLIPTEEDKLFILCSLLAAICLLFCRLASYQGTESNG